jgi:hypothetical protein
MRHAREKQPALAARQAWHLRHRIAVATAVVAPLAIGLRASGPARAATAGWTRRSVPSGSGNILAVTSLGANTYE